MNILVLGCGPAGLMAVHAAARAGHDIKVVSKKRKSDMFGAQYLHREIPGIDCGERQLINYQLRGTVEGYRNKVYGPGYKGTVSPEELEETHYGWDIRAAYDQLWDMYSDFIIDWEVTAEQLLPEGQLGVLGCDYIISSLPAHLICKTWVKESTEHFFEGRQIWATGDAPEIGVQDPIRAAPPNTVVCNGETSVGWYRSANVFGRSTTEWPGKRKPPVEGVAQVVKPLQTNCDCFPDIMRVGRFGRWKKGVLSHEAFYQVEAQFNTIGFQTGLF